MSEKAIIAGNCEGQWLITHHRDSTYFYAYNLNGSISIPPPIISVLGYANRILGPYSMGEMKISKDFKKIAMSCYYKNYGLEIYDFDKTSGIVSNYRIIDSSNFRE